MMSQSDVDALQFATYGRAERTTGALSTVEGRAHASALASTFAILCRSGQMQSRQGGARSSQDRL